MSESDRLQQVLGRSATADDSTQTASDRLRGVLDQYGLPGLTVGTALVLVVMLFLPVALVFEEAFGGAAPFDSFAAVLTDPFYTGVLASIFARPLAVGTHVENVVDWVLAIEVGLWNLSLPPLRKGLFGFTAWQAFLSTLASVAIGLPGAYVLARFEFPGRRTLRSLTILPFVLPGIMVASGFYAAFGRDGLANWLLGLVGVGPLNFLGNHPLAVVILAHAFYNAPLVTRVTTAAWESVDESAVETARSLGASRRRAFRDVVLPQLKPAIMTGALLTFIFTFLTFPIVLALGGLELATVEVWVYDRVSNLKFEEAATLAVLETAISLVLTYAYLRYEAAQRAMGGGAGTSREPLFGGLDLKRAAIVLYGIFVVVLFVGPLAAMVLEGLTDGGGLTLKHYAFLLERQATGASFQTKPLPAIVNSLFFAAATVLVAVPMGIVVSVVTTGENRGRGRSVVETLTMLPFAVSGVVFGVGLLRGLVFGIPLWGGWRIQVTGTIAIVAAHAVAAYPFVVRNVAPQLDGVDRRLVESARSLGATRTRALLDVELPLVATGLVAGAAFAFAISIGEFDSTVILASDAASYTMPVAVERYLGRRFGPAMAMGTVLLAVTAASFVVVGRLGGQVDRRGGESR
ncbi:iron ABC transporter permease [Haloarchaeobius sp. HME9146]|uniref:ABC transporter permease n=1 Tax=Haloarchaeobius sp. HME9146 TaxID=2978732 RepID=UPI0021BF7BEC|nr:iron ABC transporter permease [Haloarchaeobius sp. HME9146]MCT9094873.1 iron ABC transporter permease [Haloarchaeobius sp. HME9146]